MRSKDKLADTKIMAENLLGFNLWPGFVDKRIRKRSINHFSGNDLVVFNFTVYTSKGMKGNKEKYCQINKICIK